MKSNELRPGMAINQNGAVWVITNIDHVKPGKGPAYVQAKMRNITGAGMAEKRLRAGEEVEQAFLDKREMEYLYSDSSGHVFMDNENYEQVTLPADLMGDRIGYVKPNTSVTVQMHAGKPVVVELPKVVELEVTDTPPGIKDATKTNQLKEATLETGLKTRVPPFINIGETVRISTDDGGYQSRA